MGNVDLTSVKIAILVANGFHQSEFIACRGAGDIEAFDRAFAKLCSLQKYASGSSLHTD